MYEDGRSSRYRTHGGKILKVVGDKGVPGEIDIEEAEYREERSGEIEQYC